MPTYLVHCKSCNLDEEHFVSIAERHNIEMSCGHVGELRITSAAKYHPFPEGWWEHLGPEPVYVSSKKQLKRECEERGLYSRYLLDN